MDHIRKQHSPRLNKSKSTLINTDINFDQEGVQHGTLKVPFSHNWSGYGHIPIPITVISHDTGPSLLLTAGNHGDEYEGPVALSKLMQRLSQMEVSGRIIIIPALNLPAVLNCTRTSPIDSGNLNRAFPGKRDGTVTEMVAHYVTTELFPRVEIAIDLHAGGLSFDHLPTVLASFPRDKTLQARYRKLIDIFAAPRVLMLDMLGEDRTFCTAAESNDVLFIGGEFGGGGRCDLEGLAIIENGLTRLLHHLQMVPAANLPATTYDKTRFLRVNGAHQYVFAPRQGIFEPSYQLGESVTRGQLAGHLHDPFFPWQPPEEVHFDGDGVVICARTFAHVVPGDCIAVLASVVEPMHH